MNLPYVFSGVLSVTIQLAIVNGYGMHKADLTKPALHSALRWFFIAQTPYKVVVCLNKIAVLLLYKRIFISKPFQIACWTVLTVVVAWSIGAICATIFQCVPIEGAWDKTVDAKCIDTNAFWIAYAVCNILTDAVVLSLPIPVVFKLHLNMRERVMLCGVFMLGGFVVVCGIVRTTSVANSLHNKKDTTWNFIPRDIWTLVEANVGIICACLPVLKQPLSRGLSRIFGTTRTELGDSSRYYNAGYQLKDRSGQVSRARSRQAVPWERKDSDEEHIVEDASSRQASKQVDAELDFGFSDQKPAMYSVEERVA